MIIPDRKLLFAREQFEITSIRNAHELPECRLCTLTPHHDKNVRRERIEGLLRADTAEFVGSRIAHIETRRRLLRETNAHLRNTGLKRPDEPLPRTVRMLVSPAITARK